MAPKIRDFFERKSFGERINLNDPIAIRAMSSKIASFDVIKEFEKIVRELVIEEKDIELLSDDHFLLYTPPLATSKKVLEAKKTVFNYTPCHNDDEFEFANFLDKAEDIKALAKLPEQYGFCIQCTDTIEHWRHYQSTCQSIISIRKLMILMRISFISIQFINLLQ